MFAGATEVFVPIPVPSHESGGLLWPFRPDFDRRAMGLGSTEIDITETDGAVEVIAELFGVEAKDIEVEVVDNLLIIRGDKSAQHDDENRVRGFHVTERSYGSFQRSVRLPFVSDASQVSARFSDGVLRVVCPRAAKSAASGHRVCIRPR